MQQTITDKIFNYKYIAFVGVFVLFLIVFSNYSKSYGFPRGNSSDNEMVCEWQGDMDAAFLFFEDSDEDDPGSNFSGYPIKTVSTLVSHCSELCLLKTETIGIKLLKYHFQSDLSPPPFM